MELTARLNSAESLCSENEAALATAESAHKQAESDRAQVDGFVDYFKTFK